MSRHFALGDVHGSARGLRQVLNRSGFDKYRDTLICLGDVADGWPEVREAFDILADIPNLTYLMGNHDKWFLGWVRGEYDASHMPIWTTQGGMATVESYDFSPDNVSKAHRHILESAQYYHVDDKVAFVHAGWPSWASHPMQGTNEQLTWDRSLWERAQHAQMHYYNYGGNPPKNRTIFDRVFLGHTETSNFSLEPVKACEVWNLDQGAGWAGKLTLMDVDTEEYWQSDLSRDLYPNVKGR